MSRTGRSYVNRAAKAVDCRVIDVVRRWLAGGHRVHRRRDQRSPTRERWRSTTSPPAHSRAQPIRMISSGRLLLEPPEECAGTDAGVAGTRCPAAAASFGTAASAALATSSLDPAAGLRSAA